MEPNSQPQTFYAGSFRHSIDEKNRLTIPSRWRRGEAEEFILLPDPRGQFLLIMSPEEFLRMTVNLENNETITPDQRRVALRHLHAQAQHGGADKQGRLVLTEDACKQLGLKGEVALVGGRGRFEIWNAQKWTRSQEAETATYQHVANMIGL